MLHMNIFCFGNTPSRHVLQSNETYLVLMRHVSYGRVMSHITVFVLGTQPEVKCRKVLSHVSCESVMSHITSHVSCERFCLLEHGSNTSWRHYDCLNFLVAFWFQSPISYVIGINRLHQKSWLSKRLKKTRNDTRVMNNEFLSKSVT